MKRLLLASAALALTAGGAAAQTAIEFDGDARMGVAYDSSAAPKYSFTNRARLRVTMTGETDGGLGFGAQFRMHQAVGANAGNQGTVWIEGAFGKLTMGGVDGADDSVNSGLDGVGLTGLGTDGVDFTSDGGDMHGFLSAPGIAPFVPGFAAANSRVLYEYSMSGFSFAASHSQTSNTNKSGAVGIGYSMDGLSVGLGYGTSRHGNFFTLPFAGGTGKIDDVTASASYDFGDFSVTGVGQRKRLSVGGTLGRLTQNSLGLSGAATFDMVEVSAYALRIKQTGSGAWAPGLNATLNNAGIGMAYDLGGGAALEGGIARQQMFDFTTANNKTSRTVADFGVSMDF